MLFFVSLRAKNPSDGVNGFLNYTVAANLLTWRLPSTLIQQIVSNYLIIVCLFMDLIIFFILSMFTFVNVQFWELYSMTNITHWLKNFGSPVLGVSSIISCVKAFQMIPMSILFFSLV